MIYYTLTGRPVEQPGQDNDVRPPQRTDSPTTAPSWRGSSRLPPDSPATSRSRSLPSGAA